MTHLTPLELQIRHRPCRYTECPICDESAIENISRQLTGLGFHVRNVIEQTKESFDSIEVEENELLCTALLTQ